MGARFGANVNTRGGMSSGKKLVLLVASLVLVLLLLIIVAVGLTLSKGSDETLKGLLGASAQGNLNEMQNLPASGTTYIFVARQRIEEGILIDPDTMLRLEQIDVVDVRPNMFQANQKQLLTGAYYTKTIINPDTPLLEDYITKTPPAHLINIPQGYRAVTITVDARKGVEGWARPNSRVDVLFTYRDPDTRKTTVNTIVPFVKVLSVAGQNQQIEGRAVIGHDTTITLLVEEVDAKKIELARTLGEISLVLVGETSGTAVADNKTNNVDLSILLGKASDKKEDEPVDGRMVVDDPKTGKKRVYELIRGKWREVTEQYEQ